LTYDTLVTECAAVLEVPEVLADVQKRYQYILVDEAQDSDTDQWAMIEKLAPMSLYVVGDLDQVEVVALKETPCKKEINLQIP
jgi:DNA helicase-2/ATP-dependent DNA helicase PcrA